MATRKTVNMTPNETELFISLYFAKESLWNVECEGYKNRNLRHVLLDEIAMEMGCVSGLTDQVIMTKYQVQQKINNIRTYFYRELKNIKAKNKSDSGREDVYISKWEHFNSMMFLLEQRATSSTFEIEIEQPNEIQNDSPNLSETVELEDEIEIRPNKIQRMDTNKIQRMDTAALLQLVVNTLMKVNEKETKNSDVAFGRFVTTKLAASTDKQKKKQAIKEITAIILDLDD